MKVTVERASNSEAILNVELEWNELEKASDGAYRKLAQRYNVPGFRRGHAPRSMLERMVGKETIYQEGLESLIEDSYREAVRSNGLMPLAQPTLDAPPIEMNQPYRFTARVPVLAPVVLGDYRSVRVEKTDTPVTEEDVQKVLVDLQQQQAMWLPVERPAQQGDHVVADLKLQVGERTISDLHDNEFELVEQREGIFSGLDEHLVGMSEGETKEFTSTIPADYANTDLAGQEAQYSIAVKGVKFRELPELDDELAKSAGDYQTLDELRTAIRSQLQSRRETNARREFRDTLLKTIADQAQVDIHPVLVEDEIDVMTRETRQMLEQSRLTLEQFLDATGKSLEDYRKELEPDARERVKRDLVLDAIAKAEGIEAGDDEIQRWLDALASMGGQRMRLRQLTPGQRQSVANRIQRDKVTTFLVEAAGGEPVHDHDHDHDDHDHEDHEHVTGAESASTMAALHAAQVGADATSQSPDKDTGAAEAAATSESTTVATTNGKTSPADTVSDDADAPATTSAVPDTAASTSEETLHRPPEIGA